MADTRRSDYALLPVLEQLGPTADGLDIPWAEYGGNRTEEYEFTVSTDDAVDPYLELQAYEVGEYGHEILLNGESLAGFDIPPGEGWQYWMDAVTEQDLQQGENTIQVRRDASTQDAFAVANIVVNWRAPVE